MAYLLMLVLAATAPAPRLRAGVARVDITPAGTGGAMYGYPNPERKATGVHDPLFAKVLVLEAAGSRLAIVTMDIGSIVSHDLRKKVADELGIPHLLLAASHSHSAPAFPLPPEASPYLAEVEEKLFAALSRAGSSMFDARVGVGRGAAPLGYNRLLMRDDGRARALFDNMERIPYGPIDPEFVLLRIDDDKGAPRALLVHYGVHAVVLGPSNTKYSADYPGVLQARVEAELKGVQCMFVQGGAGDVNPLMLGRAKVEAEDFAVVDKMGTALALEVMRAARAIKTEVPARPSIAATSETLTFSNRWDKSKHLDVGITTALIDGDIAIATLPGEPHHRLQTSWKQNADVPTALFYGYTHSAGGGWAGYIPDLKSAAYGGYGSDTSTSVEIGAGETLLERHRINLYRLRGMWRDKPGGK